MCCRCCGQDCIVEARCLMVALLLLINTAWLCQAQCPPNVTSIFFVRDLTINVPLTEPVCLGCRFFGGGGDLVTFSDGVWRKGSNPGTVLNDDDFNGNVSISSTSNTVFLIMEYPDAVVDVGDTLTCSSSTANQQNIVTVKEFIFLEPTVSPNGTVNVTEGSNLTLTCSNPGNTGMPRYVWINDTDDSQLTTIVNNPPLSLELKNVSQSASGDYTCRVNYPDIMGVNRETTVTVNVLPLINLPTVQINVYQNTGPPVVVNCTYETYDGSINVTWEHNDRPLDISSDPTLTVNTHSSYSELTISPLTQDNTGQYQCIVTNSAGSVKSGKVDVTIQSTSSVVGTTTSRNTANSVMSNTPSPTNRPSVTTATAPTLPAGGNNDTSGIVVGIVGGIVVGLVLIVLAVVLAAAAYCYRQHKATDKYNVNGEATSFTLEDFHDGPVKSRSPLDQLLSSSSSKEGLLDEKPTSSFTDSFRLNHHEEININGVGGAQNDSDKVIYSKVNKPRKKPSNSAPSRPPPPLPPVLTDENGRPINLDDRETSPIPIPNTQYPPNTVLYADLNISPSSKPPGVVPVDPEKVIYSDISQLSRTASGHVVYADLNMMQSQVKPSKPAVALNAEKVVYVDIDAMRTQ